MKSFAIVLILVAMALPANGIDCPADAGLEDEPDLVEDYVDEFNGGCDSEVSGSTRTFQHIDTQEFCGATGWFLRQGILTRDTDWFTFTLPPSGYLRIMGTADVPTFVFVRTQDCDAPLALHTVGLVPHEVRSLTHTGPPGSLIWIWIAPPANHEPEEPATWAYHVSFPPVTPVEEFHWSAVRAMFD